MAKETQVLAEQGENGDLLAGLPKTYTPPISGQSRIQTIPGIVAVRVNPHPTTRSDAAAKGLVPVTPGSGYILNEADFTVHPEFGCLCYGDCLIYVELTEHYKARKAEDANRAQAMARTVLPPPGTKQDSKAGPKIEVEQEIIETGSRALDKTT